MEILVSEFEHAAEQMARDSMQALDEALHANQQFPIFEEGRRLLISRCIYVAIRAGMSTVAKGIIDGHDVSAAYQSDFKMPDLPLSPKPPPQNPPSPL